MAIRIGIIGIGAIAERAFLPGFAEPGSPEAGRALPDWNFDGCPGARVVMLASRNYARVSRIAAEFHVPQVTTDWHELISSPLVDAVCVTTPNNLHYEMSTAASRAEKHVLVDKPMALSLDDADEMIEEAEKTRTLLMVNQTQRFFPVHEAAKQIVNAGSLGRVLSMRARWSHSGPEHWSPDGRWFFQKEQAGAGALFDLGIHKFDLMRFLTGKEAVQVSAFTATLAKEIEVDDYAAAIIRFADGALGVVEASWSSSPAENSMKMYGTKGNLQIGLDADYPMTLEFDARRDESISPTIPGNWLGSRFIPQVPTQSVVGGPFRHFVDCIQTGRACISPGSDNRRSLEIMFASARAQDTARAVSLPLNPAL